MGPAGKVLNLCLGYAGLSRGNVRLLNPVPCQPKGNKFQNHTEADLAWGKVMLQQELARLKRTPKIIVPMGGNPLRLLLSLEGIQKWRGSLFPPLSPQVSQPQYNRYWERLPLVSEVRLPWGSTTRPAILPTFHPSAVQRQWEWHIWLINDLKRARDWARGVDHPRPERRWYIENPEAFRAMVDRVLQEERPIVAVDTELDPLLNAFVVEDEVHAHIWDSNVYREDYRRLMEAPHVVKVAHHMAHDWRQFEKFYDVRVEPPWFDTIAGAHLLEPGGKDPSDRARELGAGSQQVGKSLSPHIATRFTGWPFHKWLAKVDFHAYCGMDTVVSYDAYRPQQEQLRARPRLQELSTQSHRVFEPLFRAQCQGLRVDEVERQRVLARLEQQVAERKQRLEGKAWPFVEEALEEQRLRSPHLFRVEKQCPCCGGGKVARAECHRCLGFAEKPKKPQLVALAEERGLEVEGKKVAELRQELLTPCTRCGGQGKVQEDKGINLDSDQQVGDLLYRALRIPARTYQGSETVRFEQLERLLGEDGYLGPQHAQDPRRGPAREIVQLYVQLAQDRSEYATVERLEPDADGRVRCTFDLWYTPTYRVASRESLLDKGSNLQNIPKDARRFIVPEEGEVFLYPDYAQIEGRCQAILSGDEKLYEIYLSGGDSHSQVAALVQEEVGLTITRQQAKRLSFAAFYDIEASHLGQILGVSELQAHQILQAFFRVFHGAARYKRKVEKDLRENRRVECPTGWVRRWLGYVLESKGKRQGEVKKKIRKEALATGPQNMAAWVMAEGLLRVWDQLRDRARVQLHVHDSALIGVRKEETPGLIPQVEEAMHVVAWEMPFPAECVVGADWYMASLEDDEKEEMDLGAWTRASVLEHGVPDARVAA